MDTNDSANNIAGFRCFRTGNPSAEGETCTVRQAATAIGDDLKLGAIRDVLGIQSFASNALANAALTSNVIYYHTGNARLQSTTA